MSGTERHFERTDNLAPLTDALRGTIEAHRRIAVLRLLAGTLNGGGNDRLLADLLGMLGLRTSSRGIGGTLAFLELIGAIAVEPRSGLIVVSLTGFGAELADGRERADGVAAVSPDCPY